MDDSEIIICRCEDITLADIKKAIRDGARDLSDVKRLTRAGMGTCQGYTCELLIMGIIYSELGKKRDMGLLKVSPPAFPIRIKELAGLAVENES